MVNFSRTGPGKCVRSVNQRCMPGGPRAGAFKGTAQELPGCFQDFFGVARDLRLFPDAGDPAIGADQIGVAEDAHVAAAPHRFLGPDPVGLQHLVGFVRRQHDRKIVLGFELVLLGHRIGRNPENCGSGAAEGGSKSGEILGLHGAPGGVGLGIEVKHELASLEVSKRHFGAAVVGQLEAGCLATDGDLCAHTPSFRRFPRLNLSSARWELWRPSGILCETAVAP